ncbi:TetR/AcrR family transcriptional regulator [Amycolatopsis acidiphila]|uniref:TetR/AcrR family transcriptional regulator n=1 Tax=Amycolatopsis acidiphila TaxID=715473 RepID=A0A557ZLS1_9PSEU|nr:TetR/AcrR family transcriptional regulator [Amycolatopsis acidiphila]TVT12974.1 TetR/AcrR family transcriptional regulator [Amycolatopsis acidiphila]UIJ62830.1 TetR/AcrR family transcriptional regulator [Amycolatopsis acidiphila]GHG64483.1 TetR family transcriptional regulator [Amycolatopsis acidiphila]
MSVQERRERERAERQELIIRVARELAESEGWEAVTTRRLAERIEYSQPVLYSHFKGKDEIVEAVALQGFVELATAMHDARAGATNERDALSVVLHAYVRFAEENPVLYDAMFARATNLPFGRAQAPAPLRVAFRELVAVFEPLAGERDVETFTEVGWSAVHGLIALDRDRRLRPRRQGERLELLVGQLLG